MNRSHRMHTRQTVLRRMCRTALLTALICVLSVITIPIGAVPLTLGLLGIFLCGLLLPPTDACAAVGGYLLLGALGLPVFAGMQGGIGVLAGPTGGFLWGYLPTVWLLSGLVRRTERTAPRLICGMAALALLYLCGTVQFLAIAGVSLSAALAVCVWPFVLPDTVKLVCAYILSVRLRRILGHHL